MTPVSGDSTIYVSGKFDGLQKEEVWARLLATGANGVDTKSAKSYLAADPTDPKLAATGKPIYTLADLPPSLDGWLDRLKAAFAHQTAALRGYSHLSPLAHLAYGPPADDAQIARIEAAVGPLPAEVISLMRQFDGLSCVLVTLVQPRSNLAPRRPAPPLPDTVLPALALADSAHPLWDDRIEQSYGVAVLPTWEELFLTPQERRICNHTGYGPKDALKIGALKVKAGELFPRLFAFDQFHHFAGAALYLDPQDGDAKVIYGFDHWADLTSAHPVPLRFYLEALVAGVWGKMFAAAHPIKPVSKTAWPTYLHNVHGAPWVYVELK